MFRHRMHVLCTVIAVAVLALVIAARPGSSQPTQEDVFKQGFIRLQEQLVQAWLDVADELAKDPLILERGGEQAEQLLARAKGLAMVRNELAISMAAPRPGPQMPPAPGRFQFVEWDQEPMRYWVLDTVTGELDRRQAPH